MLPTLVNTAAKNLKVLYLDSDKSKCDEFEARAEQDSRLQRLMIYTANNLQTGRELARKHSCDAAIYLDGFDEHDFVYTQIELRNAQPNIDLIPVIRNSTVQQLAAQKRIGGVVTFGDGSQFNTYEHFVNLVLTYLRGHQSNPRGLSDMLEYVEVLHNFLILGSPELGQIKTLSKNLIDPLILNFDIDSRLIGLIIAADRLYTPNIESGKYAALLSSDKYNLTEVLSETSSLLHPSSTPKSTAGFIVTVAHYIASKFLETNEVEPVVQSVIARPSFLKHSALRTLSESLLRSTIHHAFGSSEVKYGIGS